MSEQELKSCPFCKREAQQTLSSGLVSCAHDECPAFLLAVTADHWNTRAPSQPVSAQPDHSAQHLNMVSAQPAGEVPEVVGYITREDFDWRGDAQMRRDKYGVYEVPLISLKQHTRIVAALQALSVTNIMLDVVPGPDGMGEEVYAKSVADVVDALGKMDARIEELQARAVVMPERKNRKPTTHGALSRQEGWNACLDEVARLNGKDGV
jgi:hypothetical protein